MKHGTAAVRPRHQLALDPRALSQRLLETVPGLLSWSTLVTLFTLALVRPFAIAVFLILYDFYWLIRALYIGIHLAASYRTLRQMRTFSWASRLPFLEVPSQSLPIIEARVRDVARRFQRARGRADRRRARVVLGHEERFLADLRKLSPGEPGASPMAWREVLHVVILPTFKEPVSLLTQSIDALVRTDYPKDRLWVVVALEERTGAHAVALQRFLQERYHHAFGKFLTTVHPDGTAGERQVKSANARFAACTVQHLLDAEAIPYEQVVVSNFDADTVVSPEYFSALTYTYLVTPDRLRCSYQPLPVYHNNVWNAPAFTRVIATNSTFWQIIQAARPERLVTYSSHSMPFRALVDVGFWDPTVVSEDSRIFWQAYAHYEGNYRVVPLYATVSMDATQAPTLLRSFVNQYKQIRRWAWGIENFPFVVRSFLRPSRIPVRERLRRLFWMLEAWHSWATASIILAALGWVTIFFGDAEFQRTVLAFNLPRVVRTLLTIGMSGLILNATLSLLLLPPRPAGVPQRRYAWMLLQWTLTPLTASVLGAIPALDAQTRLMLGRYLGFWVTPKVRAEEPLRTAVPALAIERK